MGESGIARIIHIGAPSKSVVVVLHQRNVTARE